MNPRTPTSTPTGPRTRRDLFRLGGTLALTAGTVGLAGCAGSGETGPAAPAAAGGFPVTVDGAEGPVTVPAAPSRVVSAGNYRDTDAAVALGVVPILTPDLGRFLPGGVSPWVRQRLTGPAPELFPVADDLPMERIAAARPDLILATDYSALHGSYATLSAIAPTLGPETGYNMDPWQVTTRRIGAALGRGDRAEQVVADTEKLVADARRVHPAFADRTFTISPVQADGTIYTINDPDDASARFLRELGLRLSPSVAALPAGNFPGRAVVGRESLHALDADVVLLTFNSPQARTRLEAEELFARMPAVRRGSYVPLDLPTAIAIGFPTGLSILYALEQSVPAIADAVGHR